VYDLVDPSARPGWDADTTLRRSRRISLAWCVVLVAVASVFIGTPQTVIELALGIASFTYGGLLGAFLLGIAFRSVGERAAVAGFAAGILVMTAVILFTPIAWTWYTAIGASATVLAGAAVQRVLPARRAEATA
jgi:SSS family solute:Na+ symporter